MNVSAICFVSSVLALDEILVLKCLYITKWPSMAMINDYFLTRFLISFNVMVAALFGAIKQYSGEYAANTHVCNFSGVKCLPKTDLTQVVFLW